MNKSIAYILSLAAVVVLSARLSAADYGIIPKPKSLVPRQGVFAINRSTAIVVSTSDELFVEVAANFAAKLSAASGREYKITDRPSPKAGTIAFVKCDGMAEEQYSLDITPHCITVSASYPNGLFYGVQSLCQLLPAEIYSAGAVKGVKWNVPCCRIEDRPKFPYRGMMLDVGRHFMPKESVMKVIDLMSMHKQNMFHWHLTEDQGWRIEIKKYPRLTEVGAWRKETSGYDGHGDGIPHGGYYTQEDVKEIVEYARQRYVTVIPEIELPGHSSAAIAAYPELSCFPDRHYEVVTGWGIMKDVYCPNAATFTFLEDVFTELFDLFPSKYYHIGGDECPKDRWKESPYCQDLMKVLGLQNEDELQRFFVQRMDKFLREKGGKTVIGWDEILDGGAVESTIALSYRGHAPAVKAINRKMYTILAPNRWCYIDYYQEDPEKEPKTQSLFLPLKKVYNYYPVLDTLSEEQAKYILGVQACLWTEFIPTPQHMEYMAFPRDVAMAEVGWCSREDKDWESFRRRMVKELSRLDCRGVNYSRAFYNVLFNFDRSPKASFPKEVELTLDYPEAVIRFTTDNSTPTAESQIYTAPLRVSKGDVIRAQGFTAKGKPVGKAVEKTF